ncbi:diaminopimelate decarboxylase [Nocardia tenerifensis]|uniref:Diaminopimelate decarboxylase n=1 Tax=Nocardia tenerifensis TaxID=228006 RepID=A0A318KCN3_9NOCA|nr:alanine racemase [Nocardia tenerifensis]PXX70695.1 diaminopimelate decarboxylase [Nocardia tenerifensis]
MTAPPPALPAKIHPLVRAFLDTPNAVAHTLARFGSPVHLVFPQVFAQNLRQFRDVLDRTPVRHRICYAHKANQSRAFVRVAERAGICVDVASPQELASALSAGFGPTRIEVTGPKGETFLRDLIQRGVTINVDNLWELERLAELADEDAEVPVLLRVSGFDETQVSRFGVPLAHLPPAFDVLSAHRHRINLLGFAFHLDSGDLGERVRALDACLALVERAYDHGLTPTVLNIGGGFRQVFTDDADRFDDYVRALRAALLGRGERMSWGSNTFGYHITGGAVHGTPVFHKYANTVAATGMLHDLLTTALERHGGRTVAEIASDNLLELWLEPGKSLVDHAGATVARVEFVKEIADGSVLVNVDLSRDSVTPADQEVMVDPIILPVPGAASDRGGASRPETGYVGVYFAGHLCLERDLITNHKVWLPRRPNPGDLVVFPNTAAYHMDLSAATASMRPPPIKLAVVQRDNDFQVCRDAEYEPGGALEPPEHTVLTRTRVPTEAP